MSLLGSHQATNRSSYFVDEQTGEDEDVSENDALSDFNDLLKKADIKKWWAKWVTRKYAFGEKDVPTGEQRWLKVVYSFDGPSLLCFLAVTEFAAKLLRSAPTTQVRILRASSARTLPRAACQEAQDHGSMLVEGQLLLAAG